jgi:hypothetical protein
LYETTERAFRIGERFRIVWQHGLGNPEPPGHSVVVGQQPSVHGADGQPEAEGRRRTGREPADNRTGTGLRVEVTKNEDTVPVFRGNDQSRDPRIERILASSSARCEKVLPWMTSGTSDQAPRNRGIDRPLAAIVNC